MLRQLPWSKFSREVARIGRQTSEMPFELARKLFFRRWYDSIAPSAVRTSEGALPLMGELGIYLIFPYQGVLESHFHMLAEMRSQGIAPVVVSNLPLSDTERARLLPEVARLIERPNIGYDFGGYRDAILCLSDYWPAASRLWLLNDSVWFIPQPTSWFAAARALDTDLVGATSHYAMPRVDPNQFRKVVWHYNPKRRDFHYASYALGIGRKVLRDPIFLHYWQKLDIRNDKKRTVRRGEIGLTQLLIRHGFSHAATASMEKLDTQLSCLDNEALENVSKELVIFSSNPGLQALRTQLLTRGICTESDRKDCIAFILTCLTRQPSAYVLAGFNLKNGFQFLKKSPLWLSSTGVKAMMTIISRIEGPIGSAIRREAEEIVKGRAASSCAKQIAL